MTRTLLVIDIQNDYFDGGLLPLWQAEETEARIIDGIDRREREGTVSSSSVTSQAPPRASSPLVRRGARSARPFSPLPPTRPW